MAQGMERESSMTMTAPEPDMEPCRAMLSRSSGMSKKVIFPMVPSGFCTLYSASVRMTLEEEPPGITALNWRPSRGPPQTSYSSSPKVMEPETIS